MSKNEFILNYIINVKIRINNRQECYEFQRIAFEFGARVHSQMNEEKQEPILFNIADEYPEYKGKIYAKDMTNLVIYDDGKRLQQSSFYHLENDKKEIIFNDFINAYKSIID